MKNSSIRDYVLLAIALVAMWIFSVKNAYKTSQLAITDSGTRLEELFHREGDLLTSFLNFLSKEEHMDVRAFQNIQSLHSQLTFARGTSEKAKIMEQIDAQTHELLDFAKRFEPTKKARIANWVDEFDTILASMNREAQEYNAHVGYYNESLTTRPSKWIAQTINLQPAGSIALKVTL